MKYVIKKDNRWYCRIVPKGHLLAFLPIKTKEYIKKLDANTSSEAQTQAIPIINKWLNEINRAAEQFDKANTPTLGAEEILRTKHTASEITNEEYDIVQRWIDSSDSYEESKEREAVVKTKNAILSSAYVEEHRKSLKHLNPKTAEQRISRLQKQFIPNFKYLSATTTTELSIQQWVDSYTELESPPSHQTLSQYYQSARLYIKWLRKKGYFKLPTDVFQEIELPDEKELTPRIPRKSFKDDELRLILENIKDNELKDLTYIAMYTGARIEEIMQLKAKDLQELDDGYLVQIVDSKTKAGIRETPSSKHINQLIRERIKDKQPNDYIFPKGSKNKYKIRSDNYSKVFGRLKKKLGFTRDYVFHSIRKTVATKLEQAGIPESVASDCIGHEKLTMTYGLYSDGSSLEQKRNAIDSIEYSVNKKT